MFIGHPATRDLEKDIDTLLKGEKLTGEGTGGGGEEGNPFEGLKADMDLAAIDAEFDKYKTESAKLTGDDEVKAKAGSMMRAITVLVRESKFDLASGKMYSKF